MGYAERQLPGGHKQVAIPVFENKTQYSGIEVPFTNALRTEFSRSKVATIVGEVRAPAKIKGTIVGVEVVRGGAIDANNPADNTVNNEGLPSNTVLTTEYRVLVNVRMQLIAAKDSRVLWESNFTGERVYTAPQVRAASLNSANALYNENARFNTIAIISNDIMAEAHDRMSENF